MARTVDYLELILVVALMVLAFLGALVFSQSLFDIIFAPIVIFYVWSTRRQVSQLRRKLAEHETGHSSSN